MDIIKINIESLELNTGQIEGLPANPRTWTQTEIDRLAASLLETPELFEARPIIVYQLDNKYITLAGNLRLAASRQNKASKVPCIVLPADLPLTKLAHIVLKDNGEFGAWNFGLLSQDWADLPLESWGVEVPKMEDFAEKNKEIHVGEFSENITLKLKYKEPEASLVLLRLGEDKKGTLLKILNYAN